MWVMFCLGLHQIRVILSIAYVPLFTLLSVYIYWLVHSLQEVDALYYHHFTDGETEAQSGYVTSL